MQFLTRVRERAGAGGSDVCRGHAGEAGVKLTKRAEITLNNAATNGALTPLFPTLPTPFCGAFVHLPLCRG